MSADERGWPPTGSSSGPVATSDRPATPSNVHSPTAEFGGSACTRAFSAAVTLASLDLPPSSAVIDWSSRMVTAGFCAGVLTRLASVVRTASSPTDSGWPSVAEVGDVALRHVGAIGAEPRLRQLGQGLRLAQEALELACRAYLFLAQPRAGQQHGGIVGHRRRAWRQPRRELASCVGQRRTPLEDLLLGGDDRVHRRGGRRRPPCTSASIAVDALVSASLGWPGHQRGDARSRPTSRGAPCGADAAATASAAR